MRNYRNSRIDFDPTVNQKRESDDEYAEITGGIELPTPIIMDIPFVETDSEEDDFELPIDEEIFDDEINLEEVLGEEIPELDLIDDDDF